MSAAASIVDTQARAWMQAIGVEEMKSHAVRGYFSQGEWRHVPHRFGTRTAQSCLSSRYDVDARGLQTTRSACIDIDVGHDVDVRALPWEAPSCDCQRSDNCIDAFLSPCRHERRARAKATRMREYVADRARSIVEALQAASEVSLFIESSSRGLHAWVFFASAIPVAIARRFMIDLVRRAGLLSRLRDRSLEIFPTVTSDGAGSLCRLPLAGSGRLLRSDLVTPRFARRTQDVDALLGWPRAVVSVELALADEDDGVRVDPGASSPAIEGDWPKTYGAAFEAQVLDLIECIPRGCSKIAGEKIGFSCFVGMGWGVDVTLAVLRAVIDRPGHECEAAKTEAGKKEFFRRVRSYLRHLQRGVASGRLVRGRLRRHQLRAALIDLRDGRRRAERVERAIMRRGGVPCPSPEPSVAPNVVEPESAPSSESTARRSPSFETSTSAFRGTCSESPRPNSPSSPTKSASPSCDASYPSATAHPSSDVRPQWLRRSAPTSCSSTSRATVASSSAPAPTPSSAPTDFPARVISFAHSAARAGNLFSCGDEHNVTADGGRGDDFAPHGATFSRRRVLTSAATFFVGEVVRLRADMGGGRWRVVRLLDPECGFQRCEVERIADGPTCPTKERQGGQASAHAGLGGELHRSSRLLLARICSLFSVPRGATRVVQAFSGGGEGHAAA